MYNQGKRKCKGWGRREKIYRKIYVKRKNENVGSKVEEMKEKKGKFRVRVRGGNFK